jgi:hypothetical protein
VTTETRLGNLADNLCVRCGSDRMPPPAIERDEVAVAANDDDELLRFRDAGVRHFHCARCGSLVAMQAIGVVHRHPLE